MGEHEGVRSVAGTGRGAGAVVRDLLAETRVRLAQASRRARPELEALVGEVDAALARLERGTWGRCERCHDPVESGRMCRDPLVRVCLGCLNESETRALEHDLALASTIQAGLLPPPELRTADWEVAFRYQPVGVVSGDHCDVLPPSASGDPIHFALGDVSGKGVAAALLMSHIQAAMRALAGMHLPLESVLARTNQVLARGAPANTFVTLVAGRLGPSGTVELSNAGHCPPLLARNGSVSALPADGIPLGILGSASYSARRLRLDPGDTLVLYSDGVSETENSEGEHLGQAGVIEAIRSADGVGLDALLSRCLDRATSFRGTVPQRDDVTIMAIRRAG